MLRPAYLIAMSRGWALRVYDERQFAQTTRSRVARSLDNWAGARDQPDDPARHDCLGGPRRAGSPRTNRPENLVQAFYERFSGHKRSPVSDRQGADARRDAVPGQFVCFRCPGAGALD